MRKRTVRGGRSQFAPTAAEQLESRRLLSTAVATVDTVFGTNGRTLVGHASPADDWVQDVSLTPDNKILVTGAADTVAELRGTFTRYNLDGTLDTTFGTGGKLKLAAGESFVDVHVNTDGTIVGLHSTTRGGVPIVRRFTAGGAVDTTFNFTISGMNGAPADIAPRSDGRLYVISGGKVARLNANGSADTTFATAGVLSFPQETNSQQFRPMRAVAMSDGGFVVAGQYGSMVNGELRAMLRRYTAAGALDTTFGVGGSRTLTGFSTHNEIGKLMMLPSGQLLLLMSEGWDKSHLVRLSATGALDTTFHGDGIATVEPSATLTESIIDVVPDASGRLIGTGVVNGETTATSPTFLFRMNTNGQVDTTFGGPNGYNMSLLGPDQINWGGRILAGNNGWVYHGTSVQFGLGGPRDQVLSRFSATSGAGDTSFGTNNVVRTGYEADVDDRALGSAVSPDGSTTVVGYASATNNAPMIVGRIGADGRPMTLANGRATVGIDFGTTSAMAWDAAAQADNKVIVGGRATQFASNQWQDDYALARLNADGSLDTGFGTGGKVRTSFTDANFEQISKVGVAYDGKIVAGGIHQVHGTGGFTAAAVLRYTTNGQLDTTFGTGGRALVRFSTYGERLTEMLPLADGSVLIAGSSDYDAPTRDDAFVTRLLPNGQLDTGFGTGGTIRIDVASADKDVRALNVGPDGSIYVVVTDDYGVQVRKYTATGQLVAGFGTGGVVTSPVTSNMTVQDLAVTAGGRVLLYGKVGQDLALIAFRASDGAVDTGFGTNGRATYDVGGSESPAEVHVRPDGRWVLTADATGPTTGDFAVVRVTGEFDATPPTVTSSGFAFETGQAVRFVFSEDVGASLTAADLVLRNVDSGQVVPAANVRLTYDGAARTAVFAPVGGAWADGNYRATLPAGTVADAAGNASTAAAGVDFYVLAGDFNRDRVADFADLGILLNNYNTTGKTFGHGDANYDGAVDFADLGILLNNYNKSLVAPPAPTVLEASPTVVVTTKKPPKVKPTVPGRAVAAAR